MLYAFKSVANRRGGCRILKKTGRLCEDSKECQVPTREYPHVTLRFLKGVRRH